MNRLISMLDQDDVRGVVRSIGGELRVFHNPGVRDLFELVAHEPHFLDGAVVADRVVGRGAAMLLALGRVERVYAKVISSQAYEVLHDADIKIDYGTMVNNIINRDGDDICPVEKLTMTISDPELAFVKIKGFLSNKTL